MLGRRGPRRIRRSAERLPDGGSEISRRAVRARRPASPNAVQRPMIIGSVKAIALAITLMLCADCVATAQDRKAPAASDPDRAQAAFQAGRYTEALALARRGADAAPTFARALAVPAGLPE